MIRTTAWVAGLSGVAFLWRSLTYRNPVVDLRALRERNFALGCFLSFATGIGIFATIYLTPLFLGRVRGFSAFEIGVAVFSTGVFQLLSIPIYAALANRVDLRLLMMVGLGAFALSMWQFSPITHDWGVMQLMLPQALRGAGQQFAVAPIVTLTLGSLAPARLRLASGLFNLMRNLGGAIGIALCSTVLNDRTNLHFLRLAEQLGEGSPTLGAWLASVGARMSAVGMDAADAQTAALRQLWALTMREAQTMTFGDIYFGMGLMFAVVTLLAPLMHRVAPPKAPSADAH